MNIQDLRPTKVASGSQSRVVAHHINFEGQTRPRLAVAQLQGGSLEEVSIDSPCGHLMLQGPHMMVDSLHSQIVEHAV